jgi:uncharacterized membrane protein
MAKKNSEKPALETILAWGFIACVMATVIAVVVILLSAFSPNPWGITGLGLVPMLALPLGFVFLITLFIVNAKKKAKVKS